ncbi:hypothetical protein Q3G72_029987 [Acer saccharum]|nr:hypothetical protein Q3G72_029987 [Acer saccharum]
MDSQGDSYFTNLLNDDSAYDLSNGYENQFEVTQNIDKELNQRRRTKNFTTDEDILLISAYLNISIDAIQGNEQKSVTYWERVHRYFHEHKKFPSTRNANSLMKRWSIIQLAVNTFCGDNEVGDTFVGLERPMGRKASKERVRNEKGKRIVDMSASSTLKFEEYMEDIKVRDKKRQEEKDRLHAQGQHRLTIEEEKNRIKNEKLQLVRSKEEERIIAIDSTNMPLMKKTYYEYIQMEIIKKKISSNFGE